MPAIWCRLDRLWFGHPGVLEGTVTRQPFICPLDHVFEVEYQMKIYSCSTHLLLIIEGKFEKISLEFWKTKKQNVDRISLKLGKIKV